MDGEGDDRGGHRSRSGWDSAVAWLLRVPGAATVYSQLGGAGLPDVSNASEENGTASRQGSSATATGSGLARPPALPTSFAAISSPGSEASRARPASGSYTPSRQAAAAAAAAAAIVKAANARAKSEKSASGTQEPDRTASRLDWGKGAVRRALRQARQLQRRRRYRNGTTGTVSTGMSRSTGGARSESQFTGTSGASDTRSSAFSDDLDQNSTNSDADSRHDREQGRQRLLTSMPYLGVIAASIENGECSGIPGADGNTSNLGARSGRQSASPSPTKLSSTRQGSTRDRQDHTDSEAVERIRKVSQGSFGADGGSAGATAEIQRVLRDLGVDEQLLDGDVLAGLRELDRDEAPAPQEQGCADDRNQQAQEGSLAVRGESSGNSDPAHREAPADASQVPVEPPARAGTVLNGNSGPHDSAVEAVATATFQHAELGSALANCDSPQEPGNHEAPHSLLRRPQRPGRGRGILRVSSVPGLSNLATRGVSEQALSSPSHQRGVPPPPPPPPRHAQSPQQQRRRSRSDAVVHSSARRVALAAAARAKQIAAAGRGHAGDSGAWSQHAFQQRQQQQEQEQEQHDEEIRALMQLRAGALADLRRAEAAIETLSAKGPLLPPAAGSMLALAAPTALSQTYGHRGMLQHGGDLQSRLRIADTGSTRYDAAGAGRASRASRSSANETALSMPEYAPFALGRRIRSVDQRAGNHGDDQAGRAGRGRARTAGSGSGVLQLDGFDRCAQLDADATGVVDVTEGSQLHGAGAKARTRADLPVYSASGRSAVPEHLSSLESSVLGPSDASLGVPPARNTGPHSEPRSSSRSGPSSSASGASQPASLSGLQSTSHSASQATDESEDRVERNSAAAATATQAFGRVASQLQGTIDPMQSREVATGTSRQAGQQGKTGQEARSAADQHDVGAILHLTAGFTTPVTMPCGIGIEQTIQGSSPSAANRAARRAQALMHRVVPTQLTETIVVIPPGNTSLSRRLDCGAVDAELFDHAPLAGLVHGGMGAALDVPSEVAAGVQARLKDYDSEVSQRPVSPQSFPGSPRQSAEVHARLAMFTENLVFKARDIVRAEANPLPKCMQGRNRRTKLRKTSDSEPYPPGLRKYMIGSQGGSADRDTAKQHARGNSATTDANYGEQQPLKAQVQQVKQTPAKIAAKGRDRGARDEESRAAPDTPLSAPYSRLQVTCSKDGSSPQSADQNERSQSDPRQEEQQSQHLPQRPHTEAGIDSADESQPGVVDPHSESGIDSADESQPGVADPVTAAVPSGRIPQARSDPLLLGASGGSDFSFPSMAPTQQPFELQGGSAARSPGEAKHSECTDDASSSGLQEAGQDANGGLPRSSAVLQSQQIQSRQNLLAAAQAAAQNAVASGTATEDGDASSYLLQHSDAGRSALGMQVRLRPNREAGNAPPSILLTPSGDMNGGHSAVSSALLPAEADGSSAAAAGDADLDRAGYAASLTGSSQKADARPLHPLPRHAQQMLAPRSVHGDDEAMPDSISVAAEKRMKADAAKPRPVVRFAVQANAHRSGQGPMSGARLQLTERGGARSDLGYAAECKTNQSASATGSERSASLLGVGEEGSQHHRERALIGAGTTPDQVGVSSREQEGEEKDSYPTAGMGAGHHGSLPASATVSPRTQFGEHLAKLQEAEEKRRQKLHELQHARRQAAIREPLTVQHLYKMSTLHPRTKDALLATGRRRGEPAEVASRMREHESKTGGRSGPPSVAGSREGGIVSRFRRGSGTNSRRFQPLVPMDVRASNILELIDLAAAAQEHRVRSHHITPGPPIRVDRERLGSVSEDVVAMEGGAATFEKQIGDVPYWQAQADSQGGADTDSLQSAEQLSEAQKWEATTRHLMRMAIFSPQDSHPDLQLLCGGHAVAKLRPGSFRSARAALSVPHYRAASRGLSYFEVTFQYAPDGVTRHSRRAVRKYLKHLEREDVRADASHAHATGAGISADGHNASNDRRPSIKSGGFPVPRLPLHQVQQQSSGHWTQGPGAHFPSSSSVASGISLAIPTDDANRPAGGSPPAAEQQPYGAPIAGAEQADPQHGLSLDGDDGQLTSTSDQERLHAIHKYIAGDDSDRAAQAGMLRAAWRSDSSLGYDGKSAAAAAHAAQPSSSRRSSPGLLHPDRAGSQSRLLEHPTSRKGSADDGSGMHGTYSGASSPANITEASGSDGSLLRPRHGPRPVVIGASRVARLRGRLRDGRTAALPRPSGSPPACIRAAVGLSGAMAPLSGQVGAVSSSIGLSSSGHLVSGGQWLSLPMAGKGYSVGDTVGVLVRWLPADGAAWNAGGQPGLHSSGQYGNPQQRQQRQQRQQQQHWDDGVSSSSGSAGTHGGGHTPRGMESLPENEACQLTFSVNGRVIGVSGPFVVPRGTDLFPTVSLSTSGVRAMGSFTAEDLRYCHRRVMVVADSPVESDSDGDERGGSSGVDADKSRQGQSSGSSGDDGDSSSRASWEAPRESGSESDSGDQDAGATEGGGRQGGGEAGSSSVARSSKESKGRSANKSTPRSHASSIAKAVARRRAAGSGAVLAGWRAPFVRGTKGTAVFALDGSLALGHEDE